MKGSWPPESFWPISLVGVAAARKGRVSVTQGRKCLPVLGVLFMVAWVGGACSGQGLWEELAV